MLNQTLLLREQELFGTLVGEASTTMLVTVVTAASLALLAAQQVLGLALLDSRVAALLLARQLTITRQELLSGGALAAARLSLAAGTDLLTRVLVPDDLGDPLLRVRHVFVVATDHLVLVHHAVLLLDLGLVCLVQQLTRVRAVAAALLHRRLRSGARAGVVRLIADLRLVLGATRHGTRARRLPSHILAL